jgi:hypothetical protein
MLIIWFNAIPILFSYADPEFLCQNYYFFNVITNKFEPGCNDLIPDPVPYGVY